MTYLFCFMLRSSLYPNNIRNEGYPRISVCMNHLREQVCVNPKESQI
jgi:hypothetical protein